MNASRRKKLDRTRHIKEPSVLEAACANEDEIPLSNLKSGNHDESGGDDDKKEKAIVKKKPTKKQIARRHSAVRKKVKTNASKSKKKASAAAAVSKKSVKKALLKRKNDDDDSFDSANDQTSDESHVNDDDDSKDEDFSENGDEDSSSSYQSDAYQQDEDSPRRRGSKKASAARYKRTGARGKKKRIDSSSEEEFDSKSSSDEESPVMKKRSSRPRSTRGSIKTKARDESSSEEEGEKHGRRQVARSNKAVFDSSSEDDNETSGRGYHGTPRRASAKKTLERLSQTTREEAKIETFPKKKKAKVDSDEEEFVMDDDDEEQDDDESLPDEEESEPEEARDAESEKDAEGQHVGNVDDSEVGVADDSDNDDEEPVYRSPQLKVKRSAAFAGDEDDESSSNGEQPESPIVKCQCNSTVDVVTQEDLPMIHVCFFPPDGKTRQCFALETLRKIALTTAHPQSRIDLTGEAKQTFLQPPHFRTEMSDDLIDQIASRFGRDALDLHGSYYNRKPIERTWNDVHSGIEAFDEESAFSEEFTEQVRNYIRKSFMGSQDIYCCPLCYIVAHKQMKDTMDGNDDDDDNDDIGERYPTDFSYDPMSILGYLDHDYYEIAASFCFKKVSMLKNHLRNDHNVDTKIVQGNELYARFKVRAPDGLLQRYIKKQYGKRGQSRQGDMMSYWFQGNNELFLLLLSLMAYSSLYREVADDADNQSDPKFVEKAQEFLQPAIDYFASFEDDASDLWNMVANPFRKATKEEIRDFIAKDEEEEEKDSVTDHMALHRQAEMNAFRLSQDADRQLAERFERMEEADGANDEDVDDDSVESDEDVEDEVANGGYFEESSEEEDEWEKKILDKRVAKRKSPSPRKRSSRRVSMSETKETPKKRDAASLESDDDDNISPIAPASSMRKRLVIQDDSDED